MKTLYKILKKCNSLNNDRISNHKRSKYYQQRLKIKKFIDRFC